MSNPRNSGSPNEGFGVQAGAHGPRDLGLGIFLFLPPCKSAAFWGPIKNGKPRFAKNCEPGRDAEREGFEPPEPRGSTVFKTAAIDRSAISPGAKVVIRSESGIKKLTCGLFQQLSKVFQLDIQLIQT
jgi:hypothetical protein